MRSLSERIFKWIYLVPAAVCVVLIRLLKSWVRIRLHGLDIGRIGGMYPAEWYLIEKETGLQPVGCLDIFYCMKTTGYVCNRQWLKMWERVLPITPFWGLAQMVVKVNGRLPGHEPQMIDIATAFPSYGKEYKGRELARRALDHKEALLSFTPQEEEQGKKLLRRLGVAEGKEFVCFHARDPLYLKKVMPQKDWSYHDYRDSDIDLCLPAMERLTQKGYYALRVGAVAEKKIPDNGPMIIDYATNGQRSDFLDVYLGAKCRFFLCTDSGLSHIPEIFRRPVVYVNWVPLLRLPSFYVADGMFLPKKFYLRKEKRLLSFREIIASEFGGVQFGEIFERAGVDLIENAPEEITAVTLEMEARLAGTWKTSEEDERLQQDFWQIFAKYGVKSKGFRIGADFLRQNRELLYGPALQGRS